MDNIFKPGWGGELTEEELSRVQKALLKSPSLMRKWGIKGYPSKNKILRRAMHGEPGG